MNERTVRSRFFFHPDDEAAQTTRGITPGCVVAVKAATGPRANNRYLVVDTDEAAGIAYLGVEIGNTGTFANDDDRVARIADLEAVSPAVSARKPLPVTPIGADGPGGRTFPPDVVAAYDVLTRFLAAQAEAA